MSHCDRVTDRLVTPTGESGVFLRAVAVSGLSLGRETHVTKMVNPVRL